MEPDKHVFAAVIPVHNGVDLTLRCLDALRRLPCSPALVVVVDDGSTDGTRERIEREFPETLVIDGTGELWWSASVDLGCRVAIQRGATRLLLMNNDNVDCSSNLVSELSALLDTFGGCASATAIARSDGAAKILHAGGKLDWRDRGLSLRDAGQEYVPRATHVNCDWLPGTALAFSADLFGALGGFDESLPQYRGDADFTVRAVRHGYACVVSYECWVENDKSQTGLNFSRPLPVREFIDGFFSRRSNYNIPETVRFAVRHCPRPLVAPYLARFYARYFYAFVKSRAATGIRTSAVV